MTLLPLNPLLKAPEISYHLSDSRARLLVGFELFVIDAGEGGQGAWACRCTCSLSAGSAAGGRAALRGAAGGAGRTDAAAAYSRPARTTPPC